VMQKRKVRGKKRAVEIGYYMGKTRVRGEIPKAQSCCKLVGWPVKKYSIDR